jgi:hypothetical protein
MRIRLAAAPTLLALVLAAAVATAPPAVAGEPTILYPAKVSTLAGRIFELASLGHELGEGSFTFYDENEEGRVSWRDLDKIVFVGSIGHGAGSDGKAVPRTQRVRLYHLDGSDRIVNLVIGRLSGEDGVARRNVAPGDVALIDFDQARIAPSLYRVCDRGHQWEEKDYRYCPFDGQPLRDVQVGTGQ